MIELIYHRKSGRHFILPQEWNEVSGRQMVRMAGLRHSGLTGNDQLARGLQILSNKNLLRFCFIPMDLRVRAMEHVKWILEENTLTQQLIPKYKGFYGPDGHFDNLRMNEFNHAEMAYHLLVQEKDITHLDQLVAILYRQGKTGYDHERNPDGDNRIPFNFGDISWHKKRVAQWPLSVKQAIMLWYDGCRLFMLNNYPLIFPKKESGPANLNEGLFALMHSVAGDKYGTFEDVENSFVHKIMMALTIMIEESKELEKRMPV